MWHEHQGFALIAWKLHGVSRGFPNKTWHPAVDDYISGATCTSEERAVHDALHDLTNGGCRRPIVKPCWSCMPEKSWRPC